MFVELVPTEVLPVGDVTLAYSREGEGPPVLLVAPAATRADLWRMHQVPALVAAGYQVVTFDNRGTPPSSVPNGPYHLAQFVSDTAGVITRLGIGPCPVIGSSLGALIAQELAVARPDLVAGIVLLGTRGRTPPFHDALLCSVAQTVREAPNEASAYEAASGIMRLFGPSTLLRDRFVMDWLELGMRFPTTGVGPAGQYAVTRIPDRRELLSEIAVPTLVLAFAHDVLMPPELGREVAEAIPGSRFVEQPDCGHFGFLERPAEVNGEILGFLNDLGAVRP